MDTNNPNSDALLFLRLPDVIARVGMSKSEIYRRMKLGMFPQSKRISHKVSVWRSSDIAAWQGTEFPIAEPYDDLIG